MDFGKFTAFSSVTQAVDCAVEIQNLHLLWLAYRKAEMSKKAQGANSLNRLMLLPLISWPINKLLTKSKSQ